MWFNRLIVLACLLQTPTVLSWSCVQDTECADAEGAICIGGECVCPAGQQLIFGASFCADAPMYLMSPCLEDHQCTRLATNFQCLGSGNGTEGHCLCREGFHYQNGRCWRSLNYGADCVRDEDCLGEKRDPFSLACDATTKTCGCADGYYRRQWGDCRRIANAVGESCVLDEDCQFPNGVCHLLAFTCYDSTVGWSDISQKATEYNKTLSQQDGGVALQHGALCDVDAVNTCSSPLICSNFGTCVCPIGYFWIDGGTTCYAELGSPSTPEQCVGFLAEVIDGICTCPANFYFEEDMRNCIKVARTMTDSCIEDRMCHTFGTAVRCSEPVLPWFLRTCECIPGLTVWDEARSMCRLFVGVGGECQTNNECLAGNLEIECVTNAQGQGICTCPASTVEQAGLCLTFGLELGDTCQDSQECTGTTNTVCHQDRCSCGEGYLELGGTCAPVIGGTCTANADCLIENSLCVTAGDTQTCQCIDNFVGINDQCLPGLTDINSPCNVTEQCVHLMGEQSVCADSRCSCVSGHHFRDGRCWPQVGLFQDCWSTSQCYLHGISERTWCLNSLCQCRDAFPYSEELHTCSAASTIMGSLLTVVLAFYYVLSH